MRYQRTLDVDAPLEVLWAFHERPDVLDLLCPPWERMQVITPPRSLEVGTRVVVKVWLGPLPMVVESEHYAYQRGAHFADRMVRGPFRRFEHQHRFEARGDGARLVDDIEFELPLGALGRWVAAAPILRRLERMFAYRHEVTRAACAEAIRSATRR
jgi:ligand-binding SRPBCC domain-containing protein